jgi:hypothetical protein
VEGGAGAPAEDQEGEAGRREGIASQLCDGLFDK